MYNSIVIESSFNPDIFNSEKSLCLGDTSSYYSPYGEKNYGTISVSLDQKIEGENEMSVLFLGADNNQIYCVCDSRSTKSRKINSDSWKKVLYYKPLNMLIGITGVNTLRGINAIDVIEQKLQNNEIPFSNKRILAENLALFVRQQKNEEAITNLFVGYYDETAFNNATIVSFDIGNLNINSNWKSNGNIIGNGVVYATNFAITAANNDPGDARSKAKKAAKSIFEIQSLAKKYEKLVAFGGDIHTYLLNQNGLIEHNTYHKKNDIM